MYCSRKFFPIICFLFLFSGIGCDQNKTASSSSKVNSSQSPSVESINQAAKITQAEATFLNVCQKECKYPVKTKLAGRTFWIYVPAELPLFEFKAAPKLPPVFDKGRRDFSVEFLDGTFAQATFVIEYDIIPVVKNPKNYGYTSSYTEEYSKIQSNITGVITQAFLDLETGTGPDFIVFVAADIRQGLENQSIFYLGDLKRFMAQSLPYDEYVKRFVSETRGDEAIINDRQGRHLNFQDITWPQFLTQQILNRIRFKYQQSDFSPTGTVENEILKCVAETVRPYDFTDFEQMKLTDLRKKTELLFRKSYLKQFGGN